MCASRAPTRSPRLSDGGLFGDAATSLRDDPRSHRPRRPAYFHPERIVLAKGSVDTSAPLARHAAGKKTLVFGVHQSAVRRADERGNTCPNYWHFSPYEAFLERLLSFGDT